MVHWPEAVSSSHRITQLPIDFSHQIYAQYPLFKLGVVHAVHYYSKMIAPVVEQVVKSMRGPTESLMTSSPFAAIPSSANLLCWSAYERVKDRLPSSKKVSLLNIRKNPDPLRFTDPNFTLYAALGVEDRVQAASRSFDTVIYEDGFRDRAIIFIDDIRVTGSQQQEMRRYFASVRPSIVHWIYLIDVEESIGKAQPQLEYSLNLSRAASFEEFAKIMLRDEIHHTLKCLWRLFAYSVEEMKQLVGMLDAERRAKLLDLAIAEEFVNADCFEEKMSVLRLFSSSKSGGHGKT